VAGAPLGAGQGMASRRGGLCSGAAASHRLGRARAQAAGHGGEGQGQRRQGAWLSLEGVVGNSLETKDGEISRLRAQVAHLEASLATAESHSHSVPTLTLTFTLTGEVGPSGSGSPRMSTSPGGSNSRRGSSTAGAGCRWRAGGARLQQQQQQLESQSARGGVYRRPAASAVGRGQRSGAPDQAICVPGTPAGGEGGGGCAVPAPHCGATDGVRKAPRRSRQLRGEAGGEC